MENEEIAAKFATLETQMDNVERFMIDMKNNHLRSIYKKLSTYLPRWVTIVISILSSTLIGIIVWNLR